MLPFGIQNDNIRLAFYLSLPNRPPHIIAEADTAANASIEGNGLQ